MKMTIHTRRFANTKMLKNVMKSTKKSANIKVIYKGVLTTFRVRLDLSSSEIPEQQFQYFLTCSQHQSLQKFEFELTKSFVMIFLMILQQTI